METWCFLVPAETSHGGGFLTQRVSTACLTRSRNRQSGEVEDEAATPVMLQFGAVARAVLEGLDRVDLEAEFTTRALRREAFVKG